MSRTQIEGVDCDRCGEGAQFDDEDAAERGKWSSVTAASLTGGLRLKRGPAQVGGPVDLCPDCTAELERWFAGAKLREPTEKGKRT